MTFETLLLLACAWAEEQEKLIYRTGVALTELQLEDARGIGIQFPERVRLLKVPEVPLPSDPLLRAAAETTGLISPLTCGLAVRYGIFVRSDYWGERRLVVHELAIRHSMSGSAGSSPFCGSIWENACRSAAPWDCFSRRRKGLSGRYVGAASKGLTLPGG